MKCMENMNVIAKISYFERSVITLKLRKEYLNTVTYNTPVLLQIKYWAVWYIERYSMSTYTGVTNFWKQSGFLAHPVHSAAVTRFDNSVSFPKHLLCMLVIYMWHAW